MWILFAVLVGVSFLLLVAGALALLTGLSYTASVLTVAWLYEVVLPVLGLWLGEVLPENVIWLGEVLPESVEATVKNFRTTSWLGRQLQSAVQFSTVCRNPDQKELVLSDSKTYVFAIHPHGLLATSQLCCFMFTPESTVFGKHAKSSTPLVGNEMLTIPLLSELAIVLGGREATSERIREELEAGRSITIVPGGAREIALAHENTSTRIVTFRRDGFLRQAHQYKASVVPCLSLGEHTTHQFEPSWPRLQAFFQRYIGHSFPTLAWGRYNSFWPKAGASVQLMALEPMDSTEYASPELFAEAYYEQLQAAARERNIELVLRNAK